jgi:hypothetical protein
MLTLKGQPTLFEKARDRFDPERVLSASSHVFFAFYLGLTLFLYRERLFADASYFVFNIVNDGRLFLPYHRVAAVFIQLPVLFALKADLNLEKIVQIFSASFVFFYYMIFLTIRYVYQKPNLAFLIVLLLSLGVEHTFYWPVGELSQALALSVLYYTALASRDITEGKKRVGNLIFMAAVFTLSLLNHPLSFTVLAYLTIFDFFLKKKISIVYLVAIPLCVLYPVYKKFFGATFETQKMLLTVDHIHPDFLYSVFVLFLKKYFLHLLFLLLVSLFYLKRREYLKLWFLLTFCSGYVLLINLTQNPPTNWFYTEHLYLPLTIIVGLPLLHDVFTRASSFAQKGSVILFLLAVGHGTLGSILAREVYDFRLQKMRNMVNPAPLRQQSKFVVDIQNYFEKDYMNKEIQVYWSYPVETLIQTALDGRPKTLVFSNDLEQSIPDSNARYHQIALAPWHSIDDRQLNKRYFDLSEGDYIPLNTPMEFSFITDQFIRNISIEVPKAQKSLKRNTIYYLNVLLHNRNPIPLRSALTKGREIHVSYHWLKGNDVAIWEGLRTPLEADLYSTLHEKIKLLTPQARGTYVLAVDIVAENFKWFGIDKRLSLTVTD